LNVISLTLIILSKKHPNFNERAAKVSIEEKVRSRLPRTLTRVREYFAGKNVSPGRLEILIVDDGSTDNTLRVAEEWAREMSSVRVISNGDNRGEGFSVRHAMLEASGRIALFTDADLSSPLEVPARY
jgi:dolichyl-phosphate beta-glucosyltransferase